MKTTLEDLTENQNLNDQLHHLVNEHEVNDQKQGDHEDLKNEDQHLVVIDGEGRGSFLSFSLFFVDLMVIVVRFII